MLKSLWIKFFILLLGVSIVALSSALILRELMVRDFREYSEGQMEDRVYWVIADLEGTYEKYGLWKKDIISEDAMWAFMLGFEVRVLDRNGELVMETGKALDALSPRIRKRVAAVSTLSAAERKESFLPYPLFLDREQIGTLEVRFLRDERQVIFIERSNSFLLFSFLGMGGLVILLSTVFSRRLTGPIKRLAASAEAISEGDLNKKVNISEKDEIGRLAMSFNKMIRSLETHESLRKKLLTNVAHELRTPLSAIKGEAAGMMDGLIPNDREQLRSIYDEASRLESILEGIEQLSRAQAGSLFLTKKQEPLSPVLQKIGNTFESLFHDKGVALQIQCDNDIVVYADVDKLSQIIINLLSNALKATEKGGSVTVRAEKRGHETCVAVDDTGSGIPQDKLPFIFERFFRTSEGGLGIGLAIVKELVDAQEGRIEVKSECGKGSVFSICLPDKVS